MLRRANTSPTTLLVVYTVNSGALTLFVAGSSSSPFCRDFPHSVFSMSCLAIVRIFRGTCIRILLTTHSSCASPVHSSTLLFSLSMCASTPALSWPCGFQAFPFSTHGCPHGLHLLDLRLNSRDRIRTAFNSNPESGIAVVVSGGSTLPPGSSTTDVRYGVDSPNLSLKKMGPLRFAERGIGRLDCAKVGYEGTSWPSSEV